jgi:hypothetical protein
MSQEKYIGMDVHQATISVAVMDASGKLTMECLLETKAATIVEFIQGLHGTLSLTFEEGTSAAWLHDLLKPHVSRLIVCDPRKAALLKDGNKSDRIDARASAPSHPFTICEISLVLQNLSRFSLNIAPEALQNRAYTGEICL